MTHRIAIIGGGPKGLYGLERLVAQLRHSPLQEPVEIHIFNRTCHFGAGEIYDPHQPAYLLLNYSAGQVNMWTDEAPAANAECLSLAAWCTAKGLPFGPESYPPRAVVGRYLKAGFEAILRGLPARVSVHKHVTEVTSLAAERDGYRLGRATSEGPRVMARPFHKILLCTGHPRNRPTAEDRRLQQHALRNPGTRFIPFVYPVENKLSSIPAGSRVGMKGMTLTFIDAVLALTEGRGGRFVREHHALRYVPSGGEPALIAAFSTSGLPPAPKACDAALPRPLLFVTRNKLEELQRIKPRLDFERDLWPLIELDMAAAYYAVHMRGTSFARRLGRCAGDPATLARLITDFHRRHPGVKLFDARPLLDPMGSRCFADRAGSTRFITTYLRDELRKARAGRAQCAEKAALDVWGPARELLMPFMEHDGLTPKSQLRLRSTLWPRLKRLVFGPPAGSMEKILALVRGGLLDLASGPDAGVEIQGAGFLIHGPRVGGPGLKVDTLVDARMPKVSLSRDASQLYGHLMKNGLIRAHRATAAGRTSYETGGVDLSPGECFAIGRDRRPNPDITVMGIPTEGKLFGNESLSRRKNNYAGRWAETVVRALREREQVREVAA